jgi:hypothetical protein
VRLELDHRSFAHFDPSVPGWVSEPGRHELLIGQSSTDISEVVPVDLPERVVVSIGEVR